MKNISSLKKKNKIFLAFFLFTSLSAIAMDADDLRKESIELKVENVLQQEKEENFSFWPSKEKREEMFKISVDENPYNQHVKDKINDPDSLQDIFYACFYSNNEMIGLNLLQEIPECNQYLSFLLEDAVSRGWIGLIKYVGEYKPELLVQIGQGSIFLNSILRSTFSMVNCEIALYLIENHMNLFTDNDLFMGLRFSFSKEGDLIDRILKSLFNKYEDYQHIMKIFEFQYFTHAIERNDHEFVEKVCDRFSNGNILEFIFKHEHYFTDDMCDSVLTYFSSHHELCRDPKLVDYFHEKGTIEFVQTFLKRFGDSLKKIFIHEENLLNKICEILAFNKQTDVVPYMIEHDLEIKNHLCRYYFEVCHKYQKEIETNSDKYEHALFSLVNNANLFGISEEDNRTIKREFEEKREYKKNLFLEDSKHRDLIRWNAEGNQGEGVKLLVLDKFLAPPKKSGQVLYSSRLDHKIPLEVRDISRSIQRELDEGDHGIHVSGLIADDDFGIAPKSQIIPLDCNDVRLLNDNPKEKAECIISEIESLPNSVQIINISQGFFQSNIEDERTFMTTLLKKLCQNHIVVKSAGNDGKPAPSFYHDLLGEDENVRNHLFLVSNEMAGVGLNPTSNYFSEPDHPDEMIEMVGICALGTDVYSTIPENTLSQFGQMTGTSMAAPIVSGAIAKLMSDFPDLSITEIANLIRAGADEGTSPDKGKYGRGFLDLKRAYEAAREYVATKASL